VNIQVCSAHGNRKSRHTGTRLSANQRARYRHVAGW